ncbi:hypothetical protein TanjilG_28947 [Lupinus angustifolius]|uniref:Uncharacterized protein n=1 Tax=Lupinus angustifolius TaxID=3871 RepID=A0A4P1QXH5_LUPAN|nr:hypothetical protein TanjilG_28947 [Lupinus angustifolius]
MMVVVGMVMLLQFALKESVTMRLIILAFLLFHPWKVTMTMMVVMTMLPQHKLLHCLLRSHLSPLAKVIRFNS